MRIKYYNTVFYRWFHALFRRIFRTFPIYIYRSDFPDGKMIGRPKQVGDFTIIDYGGGITFGKDVKIGFGVKIISVSTITGGSGQKNIKKPVTIGDNVEIGSNAVILPGVTIGENSTIGAGAVVTGNIPPNSIAFGIPARVVRTRSLTELPTEDGLEPKFYFRTKPEPHNTQFIEAMATYCFIKEFIKNKRVLDAGCGFGYGVDYLSKYAKEIIGVDLITYVVEWAKKHYRRENCQFLLSDIAHLDFPDNSFDAVCLLEVVHHTRNYREVLKEMRRVLKEGGSFFVSTRQKREGGLKPDSSHVQVFTAEEFSNLLSAIGFKEIEIYGLGRPEEVYALEKRLQSMRRLDYPHLRKYIPRSIVSFLVYFISWMSGITPPNRIKYEDFKISKEGIDTAPGVIAVCRK
ncbi:methyltransferase domain-containing protein [bacterium]|nr:MAG: methyltransferase domain-containing protein [bacterium]